MTDLSIIIPVYQAAPMLPKLMNQFVCQENKRFEVVLVDDGSDDGSSDICDSFHRRSPSLVKVVHQDNEGVSSARNRGILHSSGRYISFVDADDSISPGYISLLLKAIEGDADLVIFNYERVSCDGRRVVVRPGEGVKTLRDAAIIAVQNRSNSVWGKLYKREIVQRNSVCFDRTIDLGEDLCFNLDYLLHANTVDSVSEVVYQYKENPSSRTCSPERLSDAAQLRKVYERVLSFCGAFDDALLKREADLAQMRVMAHYAGRLRIAGFNSSVIDEALDADGLLQKIDVGRRLNMKDKIRFLLLKNKLYGLCGMLLRGGRF